MNPARPAALPYSPGFNVQSELSQRDQSLQSFGFAILLAYFVAAYSRVLDLAAPSLHLPMFMAILMYATALIRGGLQRTISTKTGLLYVALTGWMCFSILVTTWKGNGLQTLTDSWLRSAPLYLGILGLVYKTSQVRQASNVIAFAITLACIMALYRGDVMIDGRLIIRNSKFGDPNDLAMFCVMAIMSWLSLLSRTPGWVKRLPMIIGMGLVLITFLKTGSRGGLVGLAMVVTYLFFRLTMSQRVMLVTSLVVCSLGVGLVADRAIAERFTMFFSSNSGAQDTVGAIGSTESRLYLLERSLELTIQNPILGIGLGNFMFAEDLLAQQDGYAHGAWHQTHNMYTQVSSELGLPGLFMFVGIMVLTWRTLSRTERLARSHPEADAIGKTAFWLKAIFVAFASAGAFLSVAYQDVLPVLAGLAVTLERATVCEIVLFTRKQSGRQPVQTQSPVARPVVRRPEFAINRVSGLSQI